MRLQDLDKFTLGYLETSLWATLDENDLPLDQDHDLTDFPGAELRRAADECRKFQEDNAELIERALEAGFSHGPDYGPEGHLGYDFFLTRNGHGAGFWDGDYPNDIGDLLTAAAKKFKESKPYVGDDGGLYWS